MKQRKLAATHSPSSFTRTHTRTHTQGRPAAEEKGTAEEALAKNGTGSGAGGAWGKPCAGARTHTTNAREDRQNFTSRDTVRPRSPPGQRSRQILKKKKKRGQRKTRLPGRDAGETGAENSYLLRPAIIPERQPFSYTTSWNWRMVVISAYLDNFDLGE